MSYNRRDDSDSEFDIQALLDKYLPDDEDDSTDEIGSFFGEESGAADTEAAGKSGDAARKGIGSESSSLRRDERPSFAGESRRSVGNDFFIAGEDDAPAAEPSAERRESFSFFDDSFDDDESVGDLFDTGAAFDDDEGAVDIFSAEAAFDGEDSADDVFSAEAAFDESHEDRESLFFETADDDDAAAEVSDFFSGSDEEFVIDEDLIAELMADEVQFGGIDGFEDIEELSGFSSEEEVPAEDDGMFFAPEVPGDEAPTEESADDDSLEVKPDDFGEITNEDEFNEFVNASIGDLASGEATEADINLIVALGLEDELKKKVGEKKVSKITKHYDEKAEAYEEKKKKTLHNEYRSPSQTKEISRAYKKSYFGLKIKIAVSALFAILLLVYENLPVLGYQLSSFLDPAVYPVVYVMIDLQILLLCIAPAYEQVFAGFSNLFRGKPSPESILSLSALFSIGYSAMTAKTASVPTEPVLYNLPVALCALMTLVFAYLTIKREIFSFNVVASKKDKFALRRLSNKEAAVEIAAFGGDDEMGDVLKVEKVSFVDGYFYRTESRNRSGGAIIVMYIILTLILSALVGVYSSFMRYSAAECVSLAYTAFVTAVPVSALLAYAYPFYKANLSSYENDSTIIGENSLEEYSGASVISFDDSLAFPSVDVKVQNIKIYNNYRFDRVLYYAASVFTKTGGPLSEIFELATAEMGYSDDVVLVGVGDGYIQTEVNGKSIMFGRAEELESLGVEIPAEIKNDDGKIDSDISVMYMIFKGKVVAKMNIMYKLDSDFEYIIKQLAGCGMSAFIRTLDPNIDEKMIKSRVRLDRYPLHVIRYSSFEEASSVAERSDSGIVARGSSKSLLRTVTYCDKVLEVKRTNSFISLIAAIITIVVLAVVLMTDNFGSFRSVYSVLCHLFWMIPVLITTKAIVR